MEKSGGKRPFSNRPHFRRSRSKFVISNAAIVLARKDCSFAPSIQSFTPAELLKASARQCGQWTSPGPLTLGLAHNDLRKAEVRDATMS